MLGVEGNFLFDLFFNDGGTIVSNIVNENTIVDFLFEETYGFELPQYDFTFVTKKPNLLQYFHEGAILRSQVGRTRDSLKDISLKILNVNINQAAENTFSVNLKGCYNALDYVVKPVQKSYSGTSIEVTSQIAANYFRVKNINSAKSYDSQIWFQPGWSSYVFLNRLWLRSYIPNSMWLPAINYSGELLIKDLRKDAINKPKITLTTGNTPSSNGYVVSPAFDVYNSSAFHNVIGGYVSGRHVHDIDTSSSSYVNTDTQPILTNSDSFNRDPNTFIMDNYELTNSNTHDNYNLAEQNNISLLFALKSSEISVTSADTYIPLELLDFVTFTDVQANNTVNTQAQWDYSGIYLVTGRSHQIENKMLYTHYTLAREGFNIQKQGTI